MGQSSPDAAVASLPYSPAPFVQSAVTPNAPPSSSLSLTLVVVIGAPLCWQWAARQLRSRAQSLIRSVGCSGVCVGGAASCCILTCCMVLCNALRGRLGAHPCLQDQLLAACVAAEPGGTCAGLPAAVLLAMLAVRCKPYCCCTRAVHRPAGRAAGVQRPAAADVQASPCAHRGHHAGVQPPPNVSNKFSLLAS